MTISMYILYTICICIYIYITRNDREKRVRVGEVLKQLTIYERERAEWGIDCLIDLIIVIVVVTHIL